MPVPHDIAPAEPHYARSRASVLLPCSSISCSFIIRMRGVPLIALVGFFALQAEAKGKHPVGPPPPPHGPPDCTFKPGCSYNATAGSRWVNVVPAASQELCCCLCKARAGGKKNPPLCAAGVFFKNSTGGGGLCHLHSTPEVAEGCVAAAGAVSCLRPARGGPPAPPGPVCPRAPPPPAPAPRPPPPP
jgi:hypothetical protein